MSPEKKEKKEDRRRGESLEGGERGARSSKGEVVSTDVHSRTCSMSSYARYGSIALISINNVAIVNGIRLRHSVPAKASERLSVLWLGTKYVEQLNAHSEENQRHDTSQRRSSSRLYGNANRILTY